MRILSRHLRSRKLFRAHQATIDSFLKALAQPPVQPGVAGPRRRGHLSSGARWNPKPQGAHRTCSARRRSTRAPPLVDEIYQNGNIFNDGAFDLLKDPATGTQWSIPLEHGKARAFGPDGASCVVQDDFGGLRIAETNQVEPDEIVVHDVDPREPGVRVRTVPAVLPGPPVHADGRFCLIQKPTYDAMMADQLQGRPHRLMAADLDALLQGQRQLGRRRLY